MSEKKGPPEQGEVEIKKIAPYPFPIEVIKGEGATPISGRVLKLTDVGFLMRTVDGHHFKVGENHEALFELPVLGIPFRESVKVIKTYDAVQEVRDNELKKSFTIELHFRALTSKKRGDILKFIQAIGQK